MLYLENDALLLSKKLKSYRINSYDLNKADLRIYIILTLERCFNIEINHQQILCFLNLIHGNTIELQTGGGKTFVLALAAAYLYIKYKQNIHIMVFNSYLAKRDLNEMSTFFNELNITSNYLCEDERDIEVNYDILNKFNICYSSIDCLLSVSSSYTIKQYIVLIDEMDGIILDKNTIPYVVKNNIKDDKLIKVLDKIFKHFDLIDRVINYSNFFSGDYFVNSDNTIFLYPSAIRKLDILLKKKCGVSYNIYDLSLLKMGLTVKHFYKENDQYTTKNNNINFVDQCIGRYRHHTEFGNGINNYLRKQSQLPLNYEFEQYIYFESIAHFILKYKFIVGVSGTIIEENESVAAFFNQNTVKVGYEPRVKINYRFIKKDDTAYLNKLDEIIQTHSPRPILIIEPDLTSSYNTYTHLNNNNYKKNNILFLTPDDVELEEKILTSSGKLSHILVTNRMVSRGIDIKVGGKLEFEYRQLFEYFIKTLYRQRGELIEKLGGLLIIIRGLNSNIRVDLQIIGRTARNKKSGQVIFLVSPSDIMYQKMISYENSKLNPFFNRFDNNVLLNKMRKAQYYLNQTLLRSSLQNLDDIFTLQNIMFKLKRNVQPEILGEILFLIKHMNALIPFDERKEIIANYFVYNSRYHRNLRNIK